MKKIITLLFGMAMLTSVFAQFDQQDMYQNNKNVAANDFRKHDKDNDRYGRYYFTPKERDFQIAQIKREYDYKIQAVKNKHFMGWYQKKRQIDFLQDQREKEIRMVWAKFNDRRNKFGDHDRRDRRNW
jgi:hypothetical protein